MPILIDGYITVSTRTLLDHSEHNLIVPDDNLGVRIWCSTCAAEIGREPAPSTRLYCGCLDQEDHDEGLAIQEKYRKSMRIPKSTCVGCYLGDDGPSVHSCAIHPL
jgi:hypothetical protein